MSEKTQTPRDIVAKRWIENGKDPMHLTEAEDKEFWTEVNAEIAKQREAKA